MRGMMCRFRVVSLLVFVSTTLCGCAITKVPLLPIAEPAHSAKRVTYATVDGQALKTDIFWPDGEGPFPMVVNFHGGGWTKTDQEGFSEPMCKWLANQGYVVFNVSYRLAPKYIFPAQVNDALGAVIFAKHHAADYNGDPTRVAVMGDSAGGNLAAMAALCWDDPRFKPSFTAKGVTAETHANVFLFPVLDLVDMAALSGLYVIVENPKEIAKTYMGGGLDEMREEYRRASPMYRVRKDMSPTLFICGADDPLLPQSRTFKRKLDRLGVPNGMYVAAGETHGFTAFPFTKGATDAYAAIAAFLDLELKHPRKRAAKRGK